MRFYTKLGAFTNTALLHMALELGRNLAVRNLSEMRTFMTDVDSNPFTFQPPEHIWVYSDSTLRLTKSKGTVTIGEYMFKWHDSHHRWRFNIQPGCTTGFIAKRLQEDFNYLDLLESGCPAQKSAVTGASSSTVGALQTASTLPIP